MTSLAIGASWLSREGKRTLRSLCPRPILEWREAQYYARYGEIELHFLDILCARGSVAIDVGAHDGCYVRPLRSLAGHVHAFEANPLLAHALSARFTRKVTVHEVALSREPGIARFCTPIVEGQPVLGCATISQEALGAYTNYREMEVPADTLDSFGFRDVGYIKVDVEGHEPDVLEGARATLAESHPNIMVEAIEWLAPGAIVRIERFLEKLDYEGYFVWRRTVLPIRLFDPALMQRREDSPNLLARLDERERFGPFVSNFLFLPSGKADALLTKLRQRLLHL